MLLPAHGESKGKIGVFIEDHFDMTEYRLFNKRFPAAGFDLEYITNLWGNPTLQFGSNPDNGWVEEHITVFKDVKDVNPGDYKRFPPDWCLCNRSLALYSSTRERKAQ